MPERSETEIKLAVKSHYSAASKGSCCGGSGADQKPGDLSLGCGSPVRFAGITPGMTVLDLGSGGGVDVFQAARKLSGRGRAIGVDATPEMVFKAREAAVELGFGNVEFRLGEIEMLPVESESVDVILSNCVINLAPDKRKVFREAFRVLKHGGRLTISDIIAEKPLPQRVREDLDRWSMCEAGCLTRSELTSILDEVGFVGFKAEEEGAWKEEGDDVKLVAVTFKANKP